MNSQGNAQQGTASGLLRIPIQFAFHIAEYTIVFLELTKGRSKYERYSKTH